MHRFSLCPSQSDLPQPIVVCHSVMAWFVEAPTYSKTTFQRLRRDDILRALEGRSGVCEAQISIKAQTARFDMPTSYNPSAKPQVQSSFDLAGRPSTNTLIHSFGLWEQF